MPFSLYWAIIVGSTARNAYAGHGAVHGAASAIASLAGLGGPPGSIGEMARLALELDPATLPTLPARGTWLLLDGYPKPYPAVHHVYYAAAAAEARHDAGLAHARDIQAITLRIYAEAITCCGNRAPATPIQAQFSLRYGVARSPTHGRLDPIAYIPASNGRSPGAPAGGADRSDRPAVARGTARNARHAGGLTTPASSDAS